jgi:hypothetical protein
MIISHKYKFIFLKTAKTAGSSIEIGLSKYCGEEDIITPLWAEDEPLRDEMGCCKPRNYYAPLNQYSIRELAERIVHKKKKQLFYHHIPAKDIRNSIEKSVWDNYYKFTFERNPWDKVISYYYFACKDLTNPPTLDEFIEERDGLLTELKEKGFGVYTIDGEVIVDKICRYETMHEDLEEVRLRLGIPGSIDLPRAKSRFRKDRRNYREVLHWGHVDKIAKLFADEIDLLDYRY